ncbi:helix-turn-helix domain-containing protein [Paenibacillus sp. FSL K6-3166]|jgi:AcrR family transcriptional regulator|uniref:TetR/AcrR family transcriptional regulator n=1 Tax=unclassified Paenibacillus TaxID=185978 RepID=UPI000BA02E97|nr:helix-turn-helix domain-containing protein [Paenibacillus sp. VTT E-133291]OZQ98010.1 TetR family transcriptional regulator [Paenibacillus sp. VTT E-133291]
MNPKTRYEKERSDGKQQRLFAILEAAEQVFSQKGIEKSTMQDVASEANIGIATLFRYFPRKEKLIVAVATRMLEPMLDYFKYVADLPLTCLEKIEKLFDFFILDQNHLSIIFMVNFESYASHSSEPVEDVLNFNALNRKIWHEYSRIIQNGVEDGSIRAGLPVKETLITLMNSFALFSRKLTMKKNILLLESDLDSDDQLELLKRIFLDHLKA